MFAPFLLAASITAAVVPRDIPADAPSLFAATRGMVRDAAPLLAYDLQALERYEREARPTAPRLIGYDGYDRLGAEEPELDVAHAIAADIVFGSDEERPAPRDRH